MLQQDRVELKFVVDEDQATHLREQMGARMAADPNEMGLAHYRVTTLNFDTPDLRCFWEREQGAPSRRKIRLRFYSSAEQDAAAEPKAFIEAKHKLNGRCLKSRLDLPFPLARELAATGEGDLLRQGFPEEPQAISFAKEIAGHRLTPACLVHYKRHALQGAGEEGSLRVTFDSDISFRTENFSLEIPAPFQGNPLREDYCEVLELKTMGTFPLWLARLLSETGCTAQSHSKYCLAMLRAGINNWTPALCRQALGQ